MGDVDALLQSNLVLVVAAFAAVAVLLVLAFLLQARRISGLSRQLETLTVGDDRPDDPLLEAHVERLANVGRQVDELGSRMAVLEGRSRRAFQGVGVVRFNAFEETGGNQSFALAVLDGDTEGFVLSGLHARSGTRVYAKALSGGRADAALSDEEQRALEMAHAAAASTREVATSPARAGAARAGIGR